MFVNYQYPARLLPTASDLASASMPRFIDRAQPATCPKKNGLLRTITNPTNPPLHLLFSSEIYGIQSLISIRRTIDLNDPAYSVNPCPLPEPRTSHDPGLKPQRRVSVPNVMQHTDQPFVFPKQAMQVI